MVHERRDDHRVKQVLYLWLAVMTTVTCCVTRDDAGVYRLVEIIAYFKSVLPTSDEQRHTNADQGPETPCLILLGVGLFFFYIFGPHNTHIKNFSQHAMCVICIYSLPVLQKYRILVCVKGHQHRARTAPGSEIP